VIVVTAARNRLGHEVATVTETPHRKETTQPSNGELIMKKVIFAAAAIASLTAMGSAPAAAFGCTTQFQGGRIVQVCNSPMGATMQNIGRPRSLPPIRCQQQLGFNQPYICR
jgi:hypothetical protein